MLPAAHRLRRSADFTATMRASGRRGPGRRAAGSLVVVHANPTSDRVGRPVRVGFVVNKAVGNAVVRNRTRRVLRHLMRDRLDVVPAGLDLVVRANPAAGTATTAELARDLDHTLCRCLPAMPASRPGP